MVKLTDDELDAVMSAARPLPIDMRDAFLHAVAHELGGYQEVGPGIVHQVCREQQRIFMNGAWPDVSRSRDQSNGADATLRRASDNCSGRRKKDNEPI